MEHRICGLETEYCISVILDDGTPLHKPDLGDWFWEEFARVANSANDSGDARSPMRVFGVMSDQDIRGPITSWLASTGGKLYEDCISDNSLVEYATPECDDFENAVRAEKAGERILYLVSKFLCERDIEYRRRRVQKILFSKNNSDLIRGISLRKSGFRGSHENYQVSICYEPSSYVPDECLPDIDSQTRKWREDEKFFEENGCSFLASRILFSGAGGLRRGRNGWQYLISPRGIITRVTAGSHATDELRPMITWKNEDNTPEDKTRLQITVGDSNTHPAALRWRLGLMCAFLHFIESEYARAVRTPIFQNPVRAIRLFSSDPTLRAVSPLRDGRGAWTTVECMREWLEILCAYAEERECHMSPSERLIVREAYAIVNDSRGDPDAFSEITDWGLKLSLLRKYCSAKHLSFSDWKARRFDVYYSDISPDGIFNKWQAREARKNPSRFLVPFSEEDMEVLVWQNRAAPRAELRKRHLKALFDARERGGNVYGWSVFHLHDNTLLVLCDPMIASHEKIEEDIRNLQQKLVSP